MNKKNKKFKQENLIKTISILRDNNKKIGFTNGCFDLLHNGHTFFLSEAKKKCDFLIVGLNSDSSVKILKGIDRPIDNEIRRIEKLSLRSEVDAIVLFETQTPKNLIENLCPDIIFKGSDYLNKIVVGAEFMEKTGGEVSFVNILDGFSTTNIIKKSSKS